ncbi:helix-turn-helix domain-containing protein [Xenorhabdus sp. PR6a]|uniref:helix-turn-helix domain-containing protein n=1 Tax=Xenorhabdus TaxID=626 RepID=UPI00199527DB|nr:MULTISPECIES: helix-turn-helix domain-containing protein [unclassified Xenorhabdus]MBD2798359.1 helix-turn-helix domain-containing protein [Xenorhabdus sp. 18]MDC9583360.1 helix-turn-helix domain-containing protein [Xenorhabdus sp. PR6a]
MKVHSSSAILEKFTRSEAAIYLGVTPQTLANWAHTGKEKIPYHKIGRKVIYLKSDLDSYLVSTRRVQTA